MFKKKKNKQDVTASHTLHDAVLSNHYDKVMNLLKHGEFIDARDEQGRTSLHLAIMKSDATMVRLLIENGANVNARIYESCKELIKEDEVDPVCMSGFTPLQLAAIKNNHNIEIAAMLIECETIDFTVKLSLKGRKPQPVLDYLQMRCHFEIVEIIERKLHQEKSLLQNRIDTPRRNTSVAIMPMGFENDIPVKSSLTLFGRSI